MFVLVLALAGCSGGAASSSATSASSDASGSPSATASDVSASTETSESADDVPFKLAGPTGGLLLNTDIADPNEMSDSEVEDAERAIRAYTPPEKDTLIVNKAKEFYYYDQLSGDSKGIYEAMLALAEDPTSDENVFSAKLSASADTKKLADDYKLARVALQYDHPELFWLYNGIETDFVAGFSKDGSTFYIKLDKPYKNYEKEMKKFNDAVDDFLADIDKSGTDDEIALEIHNKLIDMIAYDTDAAEKNSNDLAHTAYGALVENSAGKANTAVCDGYSQAYVYLLQQCGINGAVILGYAGNSKADAGGHAWSVVELGKDWYEVDSTWDDMDEMEKQLEEAEKKNPKNEAIELYKELLGDKVYVEKASHYLYNVTTKEIENYVPTDEYGLQCKDGTVISLVDASVHIREDDSSEGYGPYVELMKLAPVATGTKYAYDNK